MRLAFLGTPDFAVASLAALDRSGHEIYCVVAQPDRPAGRGQALKEPATKVWARSRGLPVLQPQKVKDGSLAAALAPMKLDVLVVAAYGRILGKDLLELCPLGAVNVHGSLLPRWRGAAPIQWAIAAGDRETGVTLMQMDAGLDTGDILLQRALPILPDDTSSSLHDRLAVLGGEALVEALALLAKNRIVAVKQDPALATQARIIEKGDGALDFKEPAEVLARRLRAFTPWPGAFTRAGGKRLLVLAAEPGPSGAMGGAPGLCFSTDGKQLGVVCGQGTTLWLRRVQLEGKKPLDAEAFLRGGFEAGAVLGT
jgi:methionyl-tRNA formyltransferase